MPIADAMVTARMTPEKKEMGNAVLEELGLTASQAINQLYDLLIEKRALPFPEEKPEPRTFTPEEIAEAKAWVESLVMPVKSSLADMTLKEAKHERLKAKGCFEGWGLR